MNPESTTVIEPDESALIVNQWHTSPHLYVIHGDVAKLIAATVRETRQWRYVDETQDGHHLLPAEQDREAFRAWLDMQIHGATARPWKIWVISIAEDVTCYEDPFRVTLRIASRQSI